MVDRAKETGIRKILQSGLKDAQVGGGVRGKGVEEIGSRTAYGMLEVGCSSYYVPSDLVEGGHDDSFCCKALSTTRGESVAENAPAK